MRLHHNDTSFLYQIGGGCVSMVKSKSLCHPRESGDPNLNMFWINSFGFSLTKNESVL
jgi:hypothetical protein